MAKRSDDSRGGSAIVLDVKSAVIEKEPDVSLRLLVSATYKYKDYIWEGAGSVVPVSKNDYVALSGKVRSASCCAGTPGGAVFEVVEVK